MDIKIVLASIFLTASLVEGSCPICGGGNATLEQEVSDVRDLAIQWLADQQELGGSWPSLNTQNAILGLQLADPGWLAGHGLKERLFTKERLEYELLRELLPALCNDGDDDSSSSDSDEDCDECCTRSFGRGAGVLGQYMLALQSVCCPTDDFYGVDLKCSMTKLLRDFPEPNFNNFFQFSLAILSLCSCNATIFEKGLVKLADGSDKNDPCSDDIDTLSLEVMAMVCATDQAIYYDVENWYDILDERVQCILYAQNANKSFGNAITTALAIQALTAAGVDPTYWCCETAVTWLLAQQTDGDFDGVGATAQIIPFLGCNNFGSLQTIQIDCPNLPTPPVPPVIEPGDDTVTFDIEVRANGDVESYQVTILNGENLYFGMIRLADLNNDFTFESSGSAFGESIDAINGDFDDSVNSLYWTIHIGQEGTYAPKGIEGLFPSDDEVYIFILTDFS
ncbi:cobalamin binding intrinsic factor-like [Apostichopus japonicus]|uniref:cobalamin binding intrinsic factor-like n=1 Tax=Stichopus japonicus TaxID=307972 RepID=UPI003AB81095